MALNLVGARSITSFTDGSPESEVCKRFYYDVRDALLQSYNWNFATKMAILAADNTPPIFQRNNAFPLPADWLRTLRPFPEWNTLMLDWIVQVGDDGALRIYTNDPAPLNLRYIAKVYDVTKFSPLFTRALQFRLAGDIAEKLTQSNTKKTELYQQADATITEAKRIQAIETVPADAPTDEWLMARNSGASGPGGYFGW